MADAIDHSLYPDAAAPDDLHDEFVAADYVQRVCGAYDFGIVPSAAVLDTLRGLREVFDRFPLPASPAYHAFRRLFGWPAVQSVPPARLRYELFDLREGRAADPCVNFV
jgi:hypothetical protein